MPAELYYPFQNFNASKKRCFLTGQPVTSADEQVHVFPPWLMALYGLEDKPFKLLDDSFSTYKQLMLPCSAQANEQYIEPLEREIEAAFKAGYDEVIKLDELKIFQWAAKWLFGVIFNELHAARTQQHAEGEEFSVSQSILQRFTNLHIMLQSLNLPIVFEDFKPFSLFIFKVDNNNDEFVYRDEISTVTYSLRINDFGLIICLQDNGVIARYQDEVYKKIITLSLSKGHHGKSKGIHPIQFEEFSARVFYSAYLFNRLPQYDIMPAGDEIFVEATSLRGDSVKPIFDEWQNKTYGQVLESFWKKWGILLFEIIKDPDKPMSFLFDEDGKFIASPQPSPKERE